MFAGGCVCLLSQTVYLNGSEPRRKRLNYVDARFQCVNSRKRKNETGVLKKQRVRAKADFWLYVKLSF